jgi:hypothetical protein
MAFTTNAERDTYVRLRQLGYGVSYYGQGMLTEAARAMLRGVPTPQRWMPDFLVSRAEVLDRPRWPDRMRGKYTFLVDAKWRWKNTGRYSVEMRSVLAGPTFGMDVFYVCSTRTGDTCDDFRVINHATLHRFPALIRPCCAGCGRIFTQGADPMRELPDYCPVQQRTRESSSTPYVTFPEGELHPLDDVVFDKLWMAANPDVPGAA